MRSRKEQRPLARMHAQRSLVVVYATERRTDVRYRELRPSKSAGWACLLLHPQVESNSRDPIMSVYRRFDRLPSSDMYAPRAQRETPAPSQAPSPHGALPNEDHNRLRKAAPAGEPLARTLEWSASLPPNVQPTALLRHYARIANVIAAVWSDPKSLRSYMDCLCTDERGSRRGFPPDVLHELLELREHYDSLDAENPLPWTVVHKRG
jgi:ribosomal protein S18 acetylase RimI-like enzyme